MSEDKQVNQAFEAWSENHHRNVFRYTKRDYERDLTSFTAGWQAASQQNSVWQDISTAPHGRWILICTENDCVFQACWDGKNNWWHSPILTGGRLMFPKCWQEMPTPPKENV